MNILIACVHWPVASGRYVRNAFRRLGHDVRTVGYHMGEPDEIWGLRVDEKYIWQPDISIVDANNMEAHYIKIPIDGWIPHLILQMDTHLEYTEGWARLAWPDAPLAIYSVDNHVRDLTKLGTDFDYYFMAHHDGPAMPVDENNPKHHWLPCAYDPTIFTPSPIPMAQRKYDVAMVGVPYDNRVQLVAAMQKAGLNVFAGYGLLYEEYRDIYHNAKIGLCMSAVNDMAQRHFECSAMNNVILSNFCPDMPRLGFYEWTHYIPFNDVQEAVQHSQRLLQKPEELIKLANMATSWASQHTWDNRGKIILDMITGK